MKHATPTSRRTPARRAFTLIHLLVVISLLGVFALIWARLFTASANLTRDAGEAGRRMVDGQTISGLLRDDGWTAAEIVIEQQGESLTLRNGAGRQTRWNRDTGGVITRTQFDERGDVINERRWRLELKNARFARDGAMVLLRIEDDTRQTIGFVSEHQLLAGLGDAAKEKNR